MTADLYPNTEGMRADTAPTPAPGTTSLLSKAGTTPDLVVKVYPDSRRPFVTSDPTAPQTAGEVLRAKGVNLYPNTPQMQEAGAAPEAGEGTKGEAGTPAAEDPAVAAYQVPLPEGFTADPVAMTAFKTAAVKHGLAPEAAGEFVRMHADALAAHERAQVDAEARTVGGWVEQVRGMAEWNEPGRAEAVAAVRALAPSGARQLLDGPLGNHPGMVALVVAVGKELRRLKGGGGGLYGATPGMRP